VARAPISRNGARTAAATGSSSLRRIGDGRRRQHLRRG
jgi:hypothetical protein